MESADSPYRMEDLYNQVPEQLKPGHGYHRDCYQRFTNDLGRLNSSTEDSETSQQPSSFTPSEKVIFKPDKERSIEFS